MKTEVDLETFKRVLARQPRRKARDARPGLPRAGPSERTGLTTLITRGWSLQSPDSVRVRLYQLHTGLDTGLCADEKEACEKAKEMEQGNDPRR